LIQKPELKISKNKGCWLRTIKNNKKSFSHIWIPNIDMLMKNETDPLNVFENIQELKKK
jgi:hypothetical protein